MVNFLEIKSVSEVHNMFGMSKPKHPLITIIRKWPQFETNSTDFKVTSELYLLSMKGNFNSSSFQYGRNSYDFQEGTLVFLGPNQVMSFSDTAEEIEESGWTILFHPDLIRNSELGKKIRDYSFFDYDNNEALHLSDSEKKCLIRLVQNTEIELQRNIDRHSQDLIISNLQTILSYCLRFYERQFYTRTNLNQDTISRFEKYLSTYFESNEIADKGMPTITECGKALNLSGNYLSDLLRLETGSSAKVHIQNYVIEKAKTWLVGSNISINEVAYRLGFTYPQHFSKLFKAKTGKSPSEYRNMN